MEDNTTLVDNEPETNEESVSIEESISYLEDNSILTQVKKSVGLAKEYDAFDMDILLHINSVIATLSQLGVELVSQEVTGYDETWESIFGNNKKLNFIKSYVYIKVRLLFDPPTSSTVSQSLENQAKEYEWRINIAAEDDSN